MVVILFQAAYPERLQDFHHLHIVLIVSDVDRSVALTVCCLELFGRARKDLLILQDVSSTLEETVLRREMEKVAERIRGS